MGSPSRFLMGFPLPLPDAYRGWWEAEVGSSGPPVASVAWGRVALKDAGRRYAVAFRPSLTATRPHAPRKVVGTEGWSIRSNIGMGEKASINFLAHS
jgi:hypothetical protein